MTKVELNYNFDCMSNEGRDSIHVKTKNFKYTVSVPKRDQKLTLNDLYKKYYNEALANAAYKVRLKLSDLVYNEW